VAIKYAAKYCNDAQRQQRWRRRRRDENGEGRERERQRAKRRFGVKGSWKKTKLVRDE
jgi:hypothetical protein